MSRMPREERPKRLHVDDCLHIDADLVEASDSGSEEDSEGFATRFLARFSEAELGWPASVLLATVVAGTLCAVVLHLTPHSGRQASPDLRAVQLQVLPEGSEQALATLPDVSEANISRRNPLLPMENMHDGNLCEDNEELYGGLCYKRCSLLTSGTNQIRTSSWTCCESHPCGLNNEQGAVGTHLACSGFDVDGRGGCPHPPGACLVNEEMHLGLCYQKCELLTGGDFPHRVAAATCCRVGGLGCLDIMNDRTRPAFDVGGGGGDNDPSTPSYPHPPQISLTESEEDLPSGVLPALNLEPPEHLHDGNVCDDGEELYGGLCYKKCSLLVPEAPIRTSSWTCCEAQPCGVQNTRGSVGNALLCDGFDQAGDGACPHPPGTCFTDEEFYLGLCYKKCSLLTNNEFPHRFTVATCCRAKGLGCFDPRNDRTAASFVSGGGGTGVVHPAQQSLTEA